ncbi:Holliday junction resolvase RecU [Acetanaerobacterium elongatum]|uniref:Holliday junction resolvase RecU n=1 Tax=Acetanaerobacterium elongatum TaxID=258515 RepID=A0A1G9YZZ7_9FIRM|nr:Holliday junction resolvase RecU [Acetanaerobacterium elongatum]SDN14507.1 recombination protein U [Acetanaerobacterium elongatum]
MNDIYGGKNPANIMRGRQSRAQGELFEKLLKASCKHYEEIGLAKIEKTPEPFKVTGQVQARPGTRERLHFKGYFETKAQPDFKGTVAGGRSIVFEAKHTDTDRITQERVTQEQTAALNQHFKLRALCFVIVSFGLERFYFIPWEEWKGMKELYGRRYVTEQDIIKHRVRFNGLYISFLREETA